MEHLFPSAIIGERPAPSSVEDEWSRAIPADTYRGPSPWCRVCKNPVDNFVYDRYADGFYGFCVECHGDRMGGLIPNITPGGVCRLEVFCERDPRMKEGPWWWVDAAGNTVQDSRRYIKETVGGGFFGNSVGIWLRKKGGIWLMWLTTFAMCLAAFRRFR